jgi:osmoprotectant transport system ATP-binding protein
LLRLTNRLIPLTRGKIEVEGRDIAKEDPVKLRQSMGYAIQAVGLFPNKTIYENIATVPRLLKWKEDKIRNRADELLAMLRLEPDDFRDRYPAELSGGQQQRIGVARCLAADPKLLLMDEPFGAIDPINREDIQNEFLQVQEKLKKTILFITHDIHEAIKMGDKIAILREGRVVQYDTPEAILTHPKNKYIAEFVGADRALKILGLLKAEDAVNKQPPNIVQGSQEVRKVVQFLEQENLRQVVVIDRNRPIGYATPQTLDSREGPVRDAVKSYPELARMRESLKDVVSSMLMQDMRILPVVDEGGELIGTINLHDIHKAVRDIYGKEEQG